MCGLCGFVYTDHTHPVERATLERMNQALRHRGPDSDGFYVAGPVGLAMRRLAIIDLSSGDQPLTNESGSIWIVFNGEIYNFTEVRAELEQRGHRFQTQSDTEVIVHGYEEYGDDIVTRLNGMFAFALWDGTQKRLLLARDRLGKKPLYYFHNSTQLIFASELKALRQHPQVPRDISVEAIWHYLTLQYIPDPLSILVSVRKLPPAHTLTWQEGQIRLKRYWDLNYEPKDTRREKELLAVVRQELTRAVKMRLMSEVPLGAFLSGGIDSSIIVGLMAQESGQPIKTFSLGFEEEAFSELASARLVAEKFATEHHEFVVRFNDALNDLPKLAQALDEPFADASALPTYYLAQLTRQYVTVALNGDGGDETFAGYQRYLLDRYAGYYTRLPAFITQKLIPGLISPFGESTSLPIEANVMAGIKRLAQVAAITDKASIVRWGSYFNEAMKQELCQPALFSNLPPSTSLLVESFDRANAKSFLDRTLYTDVTNYLAGDLLVKVDRMTMAHSLEGRSPFLDYKFVEFAAQLPTHFKLNGRHHKYLLKKAFADLLPPSIRLRPKRGFGIPVGKWFKGPLKQLAWDHLLHADSSLSQKYIGRILREHDQGRIDHGKRLWALLMLELWRQQHHV